MHIEDVTPKPKKYEYVPVSCCKDTENTPNVTKCQGSIDKTTIPNAGPPVLHSSQYNDQLHTEVLIIMINEVLINICLIKPYWQLERKTRIFIRHESECVIECL